MAASYPAGDEMDMTVAEAAAADSDEATRRTARSPSYVLIIRSGESRGSTHSGQGKVPHIR